MGTSLLVLLGLSSCSAFAVTPRVAVTRSIVCARNNVVAFSDGDQKTGTCKWFNVEKGYGFIEVDDADSDIFVHQSDIYAPGFRSLAEGEQLEFRVETDTKTGKLKAVEVTGPDGAYVQGAPKQSRDDEYY